MVTFRCAIIVRRWNIEYANDDTGRKPPILVTFDWLSIAQDEFCGPTIHIVQIIDDINTVPFSGSDIQRLKTVGFVELSGEESRRLEDVGCNGIYSQNLSFHCHLYISVIERFAMPWGAQMKGQVAWGTTRRWSMGT